MSNLIDFLPLLEWFPSRLRSRGQKLHRDLVETFGGMIEDIRQRSMRGQPVPDCLAATLLAIRQEEELDDLDMAMMASAFLIGGVETVVRYYQVCGFLVLSLLCFLFCFASFRSRLPPFLPPS